MKVEIDKKSGFCFGVTTAIKKAEEELSMGGELYCLGDIVHNGVEVERLHSSGLITIDHEQLNRLHKAKVLLRAHGEPPETYEAAGSRDIEIIDATCPVVLQLQRRIKQQYDTNPDAQIVIFGKRGHAEVLGLVGQTRGSAVVIENFDDACHLDFNRDTFLYSQTTMSLDEYRRISTFLREHMSPDVIFRSFDTICRQVANRISEIASFASSHDLILFVSGKKSSNGRALFKECLRVNANSRQVESPSELQPQWLEGVETVGICGATSTPLWLMEEWRSAVLRMAAG